MRSNTSCGMGGTPRDVVDRPESGEQQAIGTRNALWCTVVDNRMPIDAQIAAAQRRQGDIDDELIDSLEAKVTSELDAGDFTYFGHGATELVKLLIARARKDDLKSAHRVATRLAAETSARSQPALELWPLLCQILLTDAEGDNVGHAAVLARYRDIAQALDARGHLVTVAKLSKAGAS